MDPASDLVNAVHQLKIDRDTWKAVALQYKAAFEGQTARFRELQDICFASQAELENERAECRRIQLSLKGAMRGGESIADSSDDAISDTPHFGTAVLFSAGQIEKSCGPRSSEDCANHIFKQVRQLMMQRNYSTATKEIERLLCGPLSPKARVEGLLLKSIILQATGPDSLYDALAACSEALELCDRISELDKLLPKIHYQRGVYYYQLHMLQQAREAFSAASEDNLLCARANACRQSCDDELELLHFSNHRSAFDEDRCLTDSLLAELDVGPSRGRLRRTSAQLRLRAAQTAKRMPLPHRWVSSTSGLSSKTDEV
ncbi:hypothetical protein B5807_11192 [Epicoccum nigrum]|uniref:Uncharacterized protein n=1 Tax=Epicoccum nigrum TaxID=105696 RepID=A0A1Y2LJE9_EPING|nr:hypothetical protein B5807_11192 [Epicoccum nigrum]